MSSPTSPATPPTPAPATGPTVSVSVDIGVPPAVAYAAVSDPTAYGRWSPESTGARLRGPAPLRVGSVFTGTNRVWLPWTSRCTVVAADPDQLFAFDVAIAGIEVARWSYSVAERPGGCRVTQRWEDRRRGLLGQAIKPAGLLVGRGADAAARNSATMAETLRRLKLDLESGGGSVGA